MKIKKQQINSLNAYSIFDMKYIEINQIIPFDIFIKKEQNYVIIIETGSIINNSLYNKLKKQDSLYIYNKDIHKQILDSKSLKDYIEVNMSNPEKSLSLLYTVNEKVFDDYLKSIENHIDIKSIELIVLSIIHLIKYDEHIVKNTMPYFLNKYDIANHSLHVAIYAVKLGNLINLSESQLLTIGIAALLHDVGYKKIDKDILDKTDIHCDNDTKEIHKHVRYSVEIVKHNNINNPDIINAIMSHHERYDGSGYPNSLYENEISDFASILAICDVFDALTNLRPHRKQLSSFEALKMMIKDSQMTNKFNQNYLNMALKSLQ